jgi:hypothetical protein
VGEKVIHSVIRHIKSALGYKNPMSYDAAPPSIWRWPQSGAQGRTFRVTNAAGVAAGLGCAALFNDLFLVGERTMKKLQTLPWLRVLSSIVGVSGAVIVGDLIREGTMSYDHALSILGIGTLITIVLWVVWDFGRGQRLITANCCVGSRCSQEEEQRADRLVRQRATLSVRYGIPMAMLSVKVQT